VRRGWAVWAIIAATGLGYLAELAAPDFAFQYLALWPLKSAPGRPDFQPWQLLTYALLHDPQHLSHILFNGLGIVVFGIPVEQREGPIRLLGCYLAAVLSAAVAQVLITPFLAADPGPVIGASGGVFGLLLAFAVLFPERRVVFLLLPVPIPARWFAAGYAAVELALGITGSAAGVAHFAHLGGMVGGGLELMHWRADARRAPTGAARARAGHRALWVLTGLIVATASWIAMRDRLASRAPPATFWGIALGERQSEVARARGMPTRVAGGVWRYQVGTDGHSGQVGVEFDRPSGADSRVIGVSYEGDPGTAPAEWPGLIGETAQNVERRLGAPISQRTLAGDDALYWYASGLALDVHAGTVVRIGLAHADPAGAGR
jgi:membrane associated rhomboid family serine protease